MAHWRWSDDELGFVRRFRVSQGRMEEVAEREGERWISGPIRASWRDL